MDLTEILQLATEAATEDIHVMLPGKVARKNGDGTVDVELMVQRALYTEDGERSYEKFPIIPSVPVYYVESDGYAFTVPIKKDSPVMLIFSDTSLAEYRSNGQQAKPIDSRRHGINYPIAMPGFPRAQPAGASFDGVTMGKSGSMLQGNGTGFTLDSKLEIGTSAADLAKAAQTKAADNAIVAMLAALASAMTSAGPAPVLSAALGAAITSAIGAGQPALTTAHAALQTTSLKSA